MKFLTKKPRSAMSLTTTFALAFLLFSIILLSFMAIMQFLAGLQADQEAIADKQQLIAKDAAHKVANFIQDKFSVLEITVDLLDPTVIPEDNRRHVLNGLLGAEPAFSQLVLLSSSGEKISHVSRLSLGSSVSLSELLADEILAQIEQGESYISPIYIEESNNEPWVLMAVPVNTSLGDFVGVLGAEVNLKFMWNLVDQLKVGETGKAYVVDRNGNLIAFSDTSRVLKGENLSYVQAVQDFINSPASAPETRARTYSGINGGMVVGTYAPLETPDWAVVTEMPWQEAYQANIRRAQLSGLIMLVMTILASVAGVFVARLLTVPLIDLTDKAVQIAGGELGLQADLAGPREIRRLATAFNSMTTELRQTLEGMEQRVVERTRDLELASDVARRVLALQDPASLLAEAVEIIRERFDLYYVQIYLTDPSGRNLAMRAGTGEAGQALLRRGHRLPVDLTSINGTVAVERRTVIVEDTATSLIHRPNPLLPDTRSEMAVPLIYAEHVVGVLDVQSARPGALSDENLLAFQILADQLAIAIQNANLFAEAERIRAEIETQARDVVRGSWRDFLNAIEHKEYIGYVVDGADVKLLDKPSTEMSPESMYVPIQISGEPLGEMHFEGKLVWTEDDRAVGAAIAQQVAQQIENLRLLAQSERYQSEANEALRRLTREGWESFDEAVGASGLGFVYKDYEVKPLSQAEETEQFQSYPLQMRDQIIGEILIGSGRILSSYEQELLDSIRDQLGNHIENLRLTEQTQSTLAQTETLYEIGRLLNNAKNSDELLEAVSLPARQRNCWEATLVYFDLDEKGDPASLTVMAVWNVDGRETLPVGANIPFERSPFAGLLSSVSLSGPYLNANIMEDKDLPQAFRDAMLDIGIRAMAIIPISQAGNWLGAVIFRWLEVRDFSQDEYDIYNALIGLAAPAVQSRRLLAQAQEQAQREQALRQITSAVRTSTDPATIMRTAVRELGTALGRKTVIQLQKADSVSPPGDGNPEDESARSSESVQAAN